MTTTPPEMLTPSEIHKLWSAGEVFEYHPGAVMEFAQAVQRALLARLSEQQPVCWGIFDSQGFYEAALDKESAERFVAHYNKREKNDPLKPYTCRQLYAAPVPTPAAQAAQAVPAWQPISEAPAERCLCLVLIGGQVHVAQFDPRMASAQWWNAYGLPSRLAQEPTHWMPLPAAPTPTGAGDDSNGGA